LETRIAEGKLPVTLYGIDYTRGGGPKGLPEQTVHNYGMTNSPGRTYRYYKGKPLFSFGDGLSLTTFSHKCTCAAMQCTCSVKNTGKQAGDAVLMAFDSLSPAIRSSVSDQHPVPIKRLVDFGGRGASTTVKFSFSAAALALTTAGGRKKSYGGVHNIVFSRGNGNDQTVPVDITVA